MRTETEIKALPLEEQQKLVVELRTITPGEKSYPNAKAIIELITDLKKWKEPETVAVKNTADHVVTVDGTAIAPAAEAKAYPWQLAALGRFLEPVKKAVALLLAGLMLAASAQAQVQTYLVGTQGQYNVQTVASLNGGTNNIVGTNATFAVSTYTTNTAVTPTWLVSNGVSSVTFTTNTTSITTNTTGMVSVVNYDSFGIQQTFALLGSGTPNVFSSWDVSGDNIYWQTNALLVTTAASGANLVTTYSNLVQVQYGYVRLNSMWTTNVPGTAGTLTNVNVEIIKKSNRQGP